MVSFSNIALFESESQVFYGKYAIGLKKEWGIIKKLEPVLYTYENSEIGNTFVDNLRKVGEIYVKHSIYGNIKDNKILEVLDNNISYLQYLKPYIVTNNKGKEFIAYNDREWRYVHQEKGITPIIFKTLFGQPDPKYNNINHTKKPFTENVVLGFGLNDINFIIVNENHQKKSIYKLLFDKFGKENVLQEVFNGNIDILSRESIKNNL